MRPKTLDTVLKLKDPKEPLDLKKVRFPVFQKSTEHGRKKRKEFIGKLLNADPNFRLNDVGKKMGVDGRYVCRIIGELKKEGHPGALARQESYFQRVKRAKYDRKRVYEYCKANPHSTSGEIANALDLTFNEVTVAIKAVLRECEKKSESIDIGGIQRSDTEKAKLVADFFLKRPTANSMDAAKELKMSRQCVRRCINELTASVKADAVEKYGIAVQWYTEQLLQAINECQKKFDACKSPTTGARWVEIKLVALKQFAKIWDIGGADVKMQLDVNLSKEQRDASAQAVIETEQLSQGIKLPQIGQKDRDEAIDI